MLLFDISCQQYICHLEGVSAPFGSRVGECAFSRICTFNLESYIQKRITSAEFSFSVQRNLRKKCVHSDSKISRQNCVNHKNHKNLVSMWHFC